MKIATVAEGIKPNVPSYIFAKKQSEKILIGFGFINNPFPWIFYLIKDGEVNMASSGINEFKTELCLLTMFVHDTFKEDLAKHLRACGISKFEFI